MRSKAVSRSLVTIRRLPSSRSYQSRTLPTALPASGRCVSSRAWGISSANFSCRIIIFLSSPGADTQGGHVGPPLQGTCVLHAVGEERQPTALLHAARALGGLI